MISTERDLAKRAATAARIMLEYEAWEMPAPPPADPLDYAWTAQVITDQAAALASIRAERDAAVAALKPFADCVFNDNGDMTVSAGSTKYDDFIAAYFVCRRAARAIAGEQKP